MKSYPQRLDELSWSSITGLSPVDPMPTSTLPTRRARVVSNAANAASVPDATSDTRSANNQREVLADLAVHMVRGLGQAVLIADHSLRVHFANASASALLADNAVLRESHESLRFTDTDHEEQLQGVMESLNWRPHAATTDSRTLRFENARRGITVIVTVRRYFGALTSTGAAQPLFVIALYQLGSLRRINTDMLRQAFDLTAAEAEIAGLLAQGYEPCQIAAVREVSVETVRAQLRNVFAKTSANRQADVVRIVMELSTLVQ